MLGYTQNLIGIGQARTGSQCLAAFFRRSIYGNAKAQHSEPAVSTEHRDRFVDHSGRNEVRSGKIQAVFSHIVLIVIGPNEETEIDWHGTKLKGLKVEAVKKLHERDLKELTFTAGQSSTLELPRNYSLDRLKLRLTTQLDRSAGTTGAPKDLSGAQLVNKIEVIKNGREVLKAIDFETLMRLCELRYGTPMFYDVASTWDGFDAQSNITFKLDAWLDFGMYPPSIRRNDSLLDTTWRGNITTLDLKVTWGQLLDVMTGAFDGGITIDTTPTLQVSTSEYIDPDAKPGDYIEFREYGIRKVITANDPKLQHKFNIGNRFRSFVIKTHSDDVNRNDILNNVKIMSGSDVYKNINGVFLREQNKAELQLETMPTGYYVLEFCKDGHLSRAVNTQGLSDLTCEMDVTKQGTTCIVEIFASELCQIPIPQVA